VRSTEAETKFSSSLGNSEKVARKIRNAEENFVEASSAFGGAQRRSSAKVSLFRFVYQVW
jgi:hypothetical protein